MTVKVRRLVFFSLTTVLVIVIPFFVTLKGGITSTAYQEAHPAVERRPWSSAKAPTSTRNASPSTWPKTDLAVISPLEDVGAETVSILPTPQTDPCLHCHIAGEEKGLAIPLLRWTLFGTAGLVFAFGIYRSASVWKTRNPWQPLTLRAAQWVDKRYEISAPLAQILNKPAPKYALRWWYCLGGLTLLLFLTQALTGMMLAFYYQPTPEAAYASIQFIETQVRFGAAVRAVHHWAANGMIILCLAHMVRVFIMGAYKPPRELNWVSGVLLLGLTLAFGFTGYLLPWDQRAFWATTVGSEIAGSIPVIGDLALVFLRVGWDISALTLSRFYALHVIVLPVVTLITMGVHFLMVRRLGIARPL